MAKKRKTAKKAAAKRSPKNDRVQPTFRSDDIPVRAGRGKPEV